MHKNSVELRKLITVRLNFKKRILIVLSAVLLAPLLFNSPAIASDPGVDFINLSRINGRLGLTGDYPAHFFACWNVKQRSYLYARTNNTWRPVANSFILKDNTGTCDIEFPYLHQYTWLPFSTSSHQLDLGIGLSSSPSDLTVRTVYVYANRQEFSCSLMKKHRQPGSKCP